MISVAQSLSHIIRHGLHFARGMSFSLVVVEYEWRILPQRRMDQARKTAKWVA
jgi:hypothetical protein